MGRQLYTGLVKTDTELEWAALARSKERLSQVGMGRISLTVPASSEPEAVAEAAAANATALRSLRVRGMATIGLPSDQVLLRVVSFPAVADDELRGMVELQLDKISPFPAESMVISYEVLHRQDDACLVVMAAAREDVVNRWAEWLKPVAVEPARVDANILGLWRLLVDAKAVEPSGRHVVLLLGEAVPDIIVTEGGVPIVFRSIGECGGLEGDAFVAEMAREVGYTLMSLELEHGAGSPASITVWYRGKPPAGLAAGLKAECLCDIHLKDMAGLPTIAEGLARRFASSGRGGLDLTPAAWKATALARAHKRRILGAAAGVLGLWVLLAGGFLGWLTVERQQLRRIEQRRDEWHKPALEVRAMRLRAFMIRRYLDTSRSALECLREVVSNLPVAGMDMTAFSYKKDDSVKISGEAGDVNHVYEFKSRLDAVTNLFLRSTLQGPRYDNARRKQIFDIDLALPGGGES